MTRCLMRMLISVCFVVFIVIIFILSTLPSIAPSPVSYFTEQGTPDDEELTDWNYGVVIDAGSTGSRLFLYKWRSQSDEKLIELTPVVDRLNQSIVKKVNPGLSSFADAADNATEYMKPLLDYAVEFVPTSKRSYCPVFIFATAGMRLLPSGKQEAIMKNLHTNLPSVTPMQIIADHIRVIEGKWEGIYSWIAVNYILGRFDIGVDSRRRPTVGMIDMGGASVQIAVELSTESDGNGGSSEYDTINLGCRDDDRFKYHLFVTTFLGYGVNEGLRKYEQFLGDSLLDNNGTQKAYARDSCLPTNLVKTVSRKDGSQFLRKGFGDWDGCVKQLAELISKQNLKPDCSIAKCYLGQVRSLAFSLSSVELYGFSEYWFSVDDVLSLGGPYNFTELASKSRDFCKLKWSTIQTRSRMQLYPKANEDRLRSQCFKSAWISAVLHTGFDVDRRSNHFRSVFSVNGQEVQWTLGALLYHMRFFPLRETQRRKWITRGQRGHSSSPGSIYLLFAIALFIAMVFLVYRWCASKKGLLRRDPSLWGYMMLTEEQMYSSQMNGRLSRAVFS